MKKFFCYALCAMLCFSCSTDDSETEEIAGVETEEVGGTGSGEGSGTGTEGEEESGTGNGSESGTENEEESGTVEGAPHEYVDLGLPSGTLWATCNVGANSPEEYGDYFAWGETDVKATYTWSTYKWCDDATINTFTKYCTNKDYGIVDNRVVLESSDDAATAKLGADWCMPTQKQQYELWRNCSWTWSKFNGVSGQLLVGPNGNSIFLPAAGYRYDSPIVNSVEVSGSYWSLSLYSGYPDGAHYIVFDSEGAICDNGYRCVGHSIRPVRASVNNH